MSHGVRLAIVAVILALGMILSAALVSKLFVRVRHEQAITVKGYAERDVIADIGKFTCACSVRGISLQEAHAKLQASRERVLAYLQQKQFPAVDIAAKTIQIAKVVK
ncbi:MAG: SIMPL domain-containing protein, partial [Kiritimatiellota bacterium]|nr:SIMPL domain-containing protein [Kiritimatiellota bacterium]